MAVDQIKLNKQLMSDVASLRDAEDEIHNRTQARKKAAKYKVNAREAATTANAPHAIGASERSTRPTGTVASSGPRSVEAMDLL